MSLSQGRRGRPCRLVPIRTRSSRWAEPGRSSRRSFRRSSRSSPPCSCIAVLLIIVAVTVKSVGGGLAQGIYGSREKAREVSDVELWNHYNEDEEEARKMFGDVGCRDRRVLRRWLLPPGWLGDQRRVLDPDRPPRSQVRRGMAHRLQDPAEKRGRVQQTREGATASSPSAARSMGHNSSTNQIDHEGVRAGVVFDQVVRKKQLRRAGPRLSAVCGVGRTPIRHPAERVTNLLHRKSIAFRLISACDAPAASPFFLTRLSGSETRLAQAFLQGDRR